MHTCVCTCVLVLVHIILISLYTMVFYFSILELLVHETFRLLAKLNFNVVMQKNYERKLRSCTGHFEIQFTFI